MSTQLSERALVAEDWDCACGRHYSAGISLCPQCGRPSPLGDWIQPLPRAPRRVRGVRLAIGVIVLNVVTQIGMAVMVSAGRMEPSRAIAVSMWAGIVFYAVVLAIVAGPLMTLRPRWLRGCRQTAPILGIEVGFAAAAGIIVVLWLGTGQPVLDPAARVLVSEGSILNIVLAFAVIVIAAPLVEELLFRGVVAESLGHRGAAVAIIVSSVLFALAHLGSLAYYTACGVVLGVLYWRRGLWASIAAHATFNGCLVVLALIVALGPARVLSSDGVSVRAPAGWQLADEAADLPPNAALAIEGPGGATILVAREDMGSAETPSPEAMAAAINSGAVPMPADTIIDGDARARTYRAGRGVEVPIRAEGQAGVAVMIPSRGALWVIEVATAGSERAEREYRDIVDSLALPQAEA